MYVEDLRGVGMHSMALLSMDLGVDHLQRGDRSNSNDEFLNPNDESMTE
jgi:hypothetical protein